MAGPGRRPPRRGSLSDRQQLADPLVCLSDELREASDLGGQLARARVRRITLLLGPGRELHERRQLGPRRGELGAGGGELRPRRGERSTESPVLGPLVQAVGFGNHARMGSRTADRVDPRCANRAQLALWGPIILAGSDPEILAGSPPPSACSGLR